MIPREEPNKTGQTGRGQGNTRRAQRRPAEGDCPLLLPGGAAPLSARDAQPRASGSPVPFGTRRARTHARGGTRHADVGVARGGPHLLQPRQPLLVHRHLLAQVPDIRGLEDDLQMGRTAAGRQCAWRTRLDARPCTTPLLPATGDTAAHGHMKQDTAPSAMHCNPACRDNAVHHATPAGLAAALIRPRAPASIHSWVGGGAGWSASAAGPGAGAAGGRAPRRYWCRR